MQISIIQKFQQSFLFERYHTFPGIPALIAYVLAQCSCCEFFYQIHLLPLFSFQNRALLVHGLTFLVGLVLMRMSGSMWNWLNRDRYEGAKFSMHNKLRLGHFDAAQPSFEKHYPCMADSKYHYYHEMKAAYEAADAEYLYGKIPLFSYFYLFGWENTPIVTSQCQIIFTLFNSIFVIAYLFSVGVVFFGMIGLAGLFYVLRKESID